MESKCFDRPGDFMVNGLFLQCIRTDCSNGERYRATIPSSGEVIGHMRLKNGHFDVTYPDADGERVYSSIESIGGLSFHKSERECFLSDGVNALIARHLCGPLVEADDPETPDTPSVEDCCESIDHGIINELKSINATLSRLCDVISEMSQERIPMKASEDDIAKLGNHRKYTCSCGSVRFAAIPGTRLSRRPCTHCGADITKQPYTTEDAAVSSRDARDKH